MQGKVTEVLKKSESLTIDGKILKVVPGSWQYAQWLREDTLIEYNLNSTGEISFFRKLGQTMTKTDPIYRKKGSFYVEKNDEQILRENVLRTAVMWAEMKKDDIANMDLKGLFGIASLMEKAIKEGFDKVME
jgi:CMP-N-acetylneuraminic acid synthetase